MTESIWKLRAQALATVIGREQAIALAKIKPLPPGAIQCKAKREDGAGGQWVCQLEAHDGEDHMWPDPILGIV